MFRLLRQLSIGPKPSVLYHPPLDFVQFSVHRPQMLHVKTLAGIRPPERIDFGISTSNLPYDSVLGLAFRHSQQDTHKNQRYGLV